MKYESISHSHNIIKSIKNYKKKNIENMIVLEGLSILEALLKTNYKIEVFLFNESYEYKEEALLIKEKCIKISNKVYIISNKVFDSIKDKENTIPLIAVIKYEFLNISMINKSIHHTILINDGIELPGNLGTIYRSAYATNIDLIINVDLKTDISKSKFINSSRGTFLEIPTINTTYEEINKKLNELNYRILLCEPKLGKCYRNYDYKGNIAIIMGSERFGINPKWYENTHEEIYIPMKEGINSINVGVATSIILYEIALSNNKLK